MGKDAGAAPAAPDPTKVIGLQSQANKDAYNYQTAGARFNTSGPDSSSTWTRNSNFDQSGYDKALADWNGKNTQGTWIPGSAGTPDGGFTGGVDQGGSPGTPATSGHWENGTSDGSAAPTQDAFTTYNYSLNNQLSPEQQKLHDTLAGTTQDLANRAPLNTSGAPSLVSGLTPRSLSGVNSAISSLSGLDPASYNQKAGDASYSAATRYLDPQVQQNQRALEARLSEQGFVPGTPGYQQAMQNFQDTNNRAYAQARDSATMQGFSVGNQEFGNSLDSLKAQIASGLQSQGQDFTQQQQAGSFRNTSRAQDIAEMLQARQAPINDLNALRGGLAQQGATPQASTGNVAPTNVSDPYNTQYQGLLDKYNAGVQSNNSTTSTLGSIAGAIAIAF